MKSPEKKLHRLVLFLCVVMLPAASLPAQSRQFPPYSDITGDSSLMKFIRELKGIAIRHDVRQLKPLLDAGVASGFDGDEGPDAFIRNWELNGDSTHFWDYLVRAIDLGGALVNDPNDDSGKFSVVFPYVYMYEPDVEDDTYSMGCITGKNVNLREKPDQKAPVKTQLSYDLIFFEYKVGGGQVESGQNFLGDPEWYFVTTYDKKWSGWVYWKYVYSLNGTRLFLYQTASGDWKISAFVQGD